MYLKSINYRDMPEIFKRKIYNRILEWKKWDGKYALLIEGARRVGKSTIVRHFAVNEYKTYIFIDFAEASHEVRELFSDMHDLDFFFLRLQTIFGVSLHTRKSLIVFDEVQFEPRARQAIKYLVADGRYDYIETGSLISIRKNVKDILIPSEEHKIEMFPMDYEEFLWATGKEAVPDLLRQVLSMKRPLGDAAHRQMMRDFRLYMLVGGMPQAVETYLSTNDLSMVDQTKRRIIDLYESDFMKIDSSGRISALFDAIPTQLSSNASRYKPHAAAESDSSTMPVLIQELASSKTVNLCYHASDPGTMMSAFYDMDRFKLFLGDTGLFITLAFKNDVFTNNTIYQKLLSDKLAVNLGYVYENVVSQILCAAGKRQFYYTFLNPNKTGSYEIDFLISDGTKIMPIEVKSSGYTRYASLEAFCAKFSDRISHILCVSPKDRSSKDGITNLPFYLLPFLLEK